MDQAALIRAAFPSHGPAWEAAIDYGIDVSLLVGNLEFTPTERLRQLQRLLARMRAFRPRERGDVLSVEDELFRRLTAEGVDFIVVGGVAAVAYGSAMATDDLDIAAPFTVENMRRLLAALEGLHPRYFMTPDKRPVAESAEQLAKNRNLYLLTDLGRLDILGSVPPVGTFEEVAQRAEVMTVLGQPVRVIALDDLIAVKAAVGRPKDRHVEHELR
ncbi:MAG TPA: hypothetical protein VND93_14480, partial [Myxococcales bacterium]|nr:hypothetical protein [Myxococcales bacterium]